MESKRKVEQINYHQPGLVIRGSDAMYVVGKAGNWEKFAELRKGKWRLLKYTQEMLDRALEEAKKADDFRKRMDQERPMAKALAAMTGDTVHQEDFIKLTDEERVKVFGLPAMTEDEKEKMREALPDTLSKVEVQRSLYRLYEAEEAEKKTKEAMALAESKKPGEEIKNTPELQVVSVDDPEVAGE